jgi:nucleoside-diphosphate-sugar epimerase
VAIYGDRLRKPMIELTDELVPNSFDGYAIHKMEAEGIIRRSKTDWSILRLTYVVSPHKIKMDNIMFEMPLETCVETCDTQDVGLAFANAVERNDISGETFHIAGGLKCRTTYGEYINRMMELFGIGRDKLPVEAFAKRGYHCGFMNTDSSREKLAFQVHDLEDQLRQVRERTRLTRFFGRIFRPIVIAWIVNRSPYYREWKKTHTRLSVGMNGARSS